MFSQQLIKLFNRAKLPDTPGVYFFKDAENKILYIGRATSLYDRVRSYFRDDLIHTRGPLLVDMIFQCKKIDFKETDSVLEAIILENNLIKEYQPYYNTKEKDNKSWNYVIITDEEFPRIFLVRGRTLDIVKSGLLKFKIKEKFGPYPQGSLLREALRIIRKIFPFRDAKSSISYQESFYKAIGLSPDTSSPEAKKEYNKTIRNIILFFKGKKDELINILTKEMNEFAKKMEFEKAENIKNTLYSLKHIQDIALIKENEGLAKKEGFRIEAYDIAHMSGKNNVGVMTVAYDNEIEKMEYRKFRLSEEINDDVFNMKEILTRRFAHTEWQFPNLIVIDGGIGQRNAAIEILKKIDINIPVISVVKNEKHKAKYFLGDEKIINKYKEIILKINMEAHRFAINYHKNLRKRNFLKRL